MVVTRYGDRVFDVSGDVMVTRYGDRVLMAVGFEVVQGKCNGDGCMMDSTWKSMEEYT